MLQSIITIQLVGSIFAIIIGSLILWWIRHLTKSKFEKSSSAGFWVRAFCFGFDLSIVNFLVLLLAFDGSLHVSGFISLIISFSYFFFFWMFFGTTPAGMLVGIRVEDKNRNNLKVWQLLVRIALFPILFIGWILILFDRDEKKALHDFVARTKVIYGKFEVIGKKGMEKIAIISLIVAFLVLFVSLVIVGGGEKISDYPESSQIEYFDLNNDSITDVLAIDFYQDGEIDVLKYDLNNDNIIDFSTYDTDADGIAESIDVNNDGRLDGFDFNNDNVLDAKVFSGQFFIWLWKIWFAFLCMLIPATIGFFIYKENN